MKGIPIKFRAREIGMGSIVEGSLVERCGKSGRKYYSIIDKYENEYVVNTKSIAQLCGYDAAGNEIYEGDTVTDGEDNYKVSLDDVTLRFEDNFRIGSAQISKFVKVGV